MWQMTIPVDVGHIIYLGPLALRKSSSSNCLSFNLFLFGRAMRAAFENSRSRSCWGRQRFVELFEHCIVTWT